MQLTGNAGRLFTRTVLYRYKSDSSVRNRMNGAGEAVKLLLTLPQLRIRNKILSVSPAQGGKRNFSVSDLNKMSNEKAKQEGPSHLSRTDFVEAKEMSRFYVN